MSLPSVRSLVRLLSRATAAPIEPTAAADSAEGLARRNLFGPTSAMKRRLAVAGLFGTRCGLQRGAILMVKDFQARGFEVHAIDLSSALGWARDAPFPEALAPDRLAGLRSTDLIIHVNPDRFVDALRALPRSLRRGSNIIGYWVWELTVLPPSWRDSARHCDAIWAPSPFVADTLARQLPDFAGVIRVVPHAVDRDPIPHRTVESRRIARRQLGFSEDDFVLGYAFAFYSNYARKNPAAAIDAFRRAFPAADAPARLLIRMHDGDAHPHQRAHLMESVADDPRIHVVDLAHERLPIVAFYHALDLYLALSRSEGYGLHLAEAAQAGLPVIATGWGLSPDIQARAGVHPVDYRLVPVDDPQGFFEPGRGAVWAEPDVAHAARLIEEIRAKIRSSRPVAERVRE